MKRTVFVIAAAALITCAVAMAPQGSNRGNVGVPDSIATYEHLANAIIAIRDTEDSLVHGMLVRHLNAARAHLDVAVQSNGTDRRRALETAAMEITNLANEGDKRVQAVRQRLLKAGHHHHTDAETQDDYMFIDSREKRQLLALAGEIAKMGNAAADDIGTASERLAKIARNAIRSE